MAALPSSEPHGQDDSPKLGSILDEGDATPSQITQETTGKVAGGQGGSTQLSEPQGGQDGPPAHASQPPSPGRKRARNVVEDAIKATFGNIYESASGKSSEVSRVEGEPSFPRKALNPADAYPFPTRSMTPTDALSKEEERKRAIEDKANEKARSRTRQRRTKVEIDSAVFNETRRRMTETVLASPRNDDPLSADSVDLLGFGDDAKAFARLAASKDVKPPLAVAIFGSWGSGKSFFMRLIQEHVQRLSDGKTDSRAPEATSDSFHRGIAQIRFNAWHYSETNLWASLVDHLFTQLGAHIKSGNSLGEAGRSVLDDLSTTRTLTIESAERLAAQRRTQAALAENLTRAEANRTEWQRKVMSRPSTYLDIIQRVVASDAADEASLDAKLKQEIRAAMHDLGIDSMAVTAQTVADELRATGSLVSKAKIAFNKVAVRAGGKLKAALTLACIPAALLLLWVALRGLVGVNIPEVLAIIVQVTASLGAIFVALKKINAIAAPVVAKMEMVRKTVDDKLAAGLAAHAQLLEKGAEELRKADAQVAAAQQDLAASAAGLVKAVEDFHGSTGTGRLLKFLRTRAKDGHYAQHLGLVASVRRDFEELSIGMQGEGARIEMPAEELASLHARLAVLTGPDSALLAEDREVLKGLTQRLNEISANAKSLRPPFSRLVLYIDDLDRCSHEKVIDVLQAVHMLMAFPLFTVFVAVDVRWLSQALVAKYGGLLAPLDQPRGRDRAAPHDYLEKIFQLPYWIEEVNAKSGAKLLEALLPLDEDDSPDQDPTASGESTKEPAESDSMGAFTSTVRSLKFKRFHRDLVGLFLPYFASSPRKLLWFVNAFRVLKATSRPLSEGDEEQQDFVIIMQLALASISRKQFHVWLATLDGFDGRDSLVRMVDESPISASSHIFWDIARKAAEHAEHLGYFYFDADMLRHYGRRAHRFCFSTPEPQNSMQADAEA